MPSASVKDILSYLRSFQSGVVCFSGGVDSTLLLSLAVEAWATPPAAITFLSPLLPAREKERIRKLARRFPVRHRFLKTDEHRRPEFQSNPPDRCYYCKQVRLGRALGFVHKHRLSFLLDGTNADDLKSFRPGIRAGKEAGVISPFADLGWSKQKIREVSRRRGLPTWNLPASPCLATRVAFGQAITPKLLRQVEQGEDLLHRLGFADCRLRVHDRLLRIEVPPEGFKRLLRPGLKEKLIQGLEPLGFSFLTLDLMGLCTGSMEKTITLMQRKP